MRSQISTNNPPLETLNPEIVSSYKILQLKMTACHTSFLRIAASEIFLCKLSNSYNISYNFA